MAAETPFQTVGPFFNFALAFAGGDTLATAATAGQPITIAGVLRDGAGAPVADALIEIWQANANGRYHHPSDTGEAAIDPTFDGFGRVPTDAAGGFSFRTIKPGAVPGPDGRPQAPHVLISILARGILTRLVTRAYFEDDSMTADDAVLSLVPAARRPTLIARRVAPGRYRFDIVLQGEHETVFFDI